MQKRTKQQRRGICPVCGQERDLTREHVPPKNLFLKPRPKNTITVWTCEVCNSGYALDEEHFRIYVTAGAEPGSEGHRLWVEKVEKSTFKRSPALRQKLSDDMDMIQEYHRTSPLKDYSGQIISDSLVPYALPLEANRINRVVEKLVRCLYLKHFECLLAPETEISIYTCPLSVSDIERAVVERAGFVGERIDELFIYWFGECEASKRIRWVLLFHGGDKYFHGIIGPGAVAS